MLYRAPRLGRESWRTVMAGMILALLLIASLGSMFGLLYAVGALLIGQSLI